MPDPEPLNPAIRQRMAGQRRTDTKPELALRSELWRRGYRFRVDHRVIGRRQRVDIAFTRRRVAVFVDGCFWHRCPLHGTLPKNNREWWHDKLEANVRRDRATDEALTASGWRVVRVWEHEPVPEAADRVVGALDAAVVSLRHTVGRSSRRKDTPAGHPCRVERPGDGVGGVE